MKSSILISGPQNSGKSTHARELISLFGQDEILSFTGEKFLQFIDKNPVIPTGTKVVLIEEVNSLDCLVVIKPYTETTRLIHIVTTKVPVAELPDEIKSAFKVIEMQLVQPQDIVTNSKVYTSGDIETIDFIEGKGLNYHLGCVVKYISRASREEPSKELEDLEKAQWYLNRHIERVKKESRSYDREAGVAQFEVIVPDYIKNDLPSPEALLQMVSTLQSPPATGDGEYRNKDRKNEEYCIRQFWSELASTILESSFISITDETIGIEPVEAYTFYQWRRKIHYPTQLDKEAFIEALRHLTPGFLHIQPTSFEPPTLKQLVFSRKVLALYIHDKINDQVSF